MENKIKYILTAIIVLIVGLIAFSVYQQRAITNLKQEIVSGNSLNNNVSGSDLSLYQAVKKNLEDSAKEIKGVIASKSGNLLTIQAEIVDFSKLSGLTKEALGENISTFPMTKKNYEVSVSDKTQFESLKLGDLSVGMTVVVDSDNLVYKSDQLNALKVVATKPDNLSSSQDFIDQIKTVSGEIKEVNTKYFTVGVVLTDYSKIKDPFSGDPNTYPKIPKDYKIIFADKTVFSKGGKSDLKVGDNITAYSDKPIFFVSEFIATKIDGPLPKVSSLPDFPGQVISKGDGVLTVKAADNYGGKTYTVKVTKQTLLYKVEHAANPPKQSVIAFSDIRENDQVWILATGSIDDKSEFEAMGVSLQL